MALVPPFIRHVDAAVPLVLLGGVHVGCYELFGTHEVRAIRDLKGKTVAVPALGSPHHLFIASMAQYVGLDPHTAINWAPHPMAASVQLLAEGKVDALIALPPVPQALRARKIGHVIVNSGVDRPWSQYFCGLMPSNRAFVQQHPMATKRALRALLQAADLCAVEPERTAQRLVDKGFTPRYDYALQTIQEIAYAKWREYDPAETVRFYALRLHELGLIKSTPQQSIGQSTDGRCFHEVKQELKASRGAPRHGHFTSAQR